MNIIVSGGTRGIGKEIVLHLAQNPGNSIVVTGRNTEALGVLSEKAAHKNIHPYNIDLAVYDNYEKDLLKYIEEHFEHIDILINNAGMLVTGDFLMFDPEKARQMMETNFFGTASMIRSLYPLMVKGSHIVNISSMGGYQGSTKYRGMSYYSCSKAALSCLSESLAVEFRETGIAVNCLALGAVQTEMFEEAFPGFKAPVNAKEIARYISDFALSGNKFFNGKVIPVAFSDP